MDSIPQELKVGLVVLVVFLALDLPMILYINKEMYQSQLKKINKRRKVNKVRMISAAVITYLLLAVGIYYFGVKQKSVYSGALFGLVVYGVYNFTNLATISKFGVKESVIDTAWGTILCALVTYIVLVINQYFLLNTPVRIVPDILTTTEIPSN
jgi:uncharacterized membrane protein